MHSIDNRQSPFDNQQSEVHALSATAIIPGEVPERILIAPWGNVESDSGEFIVDDESARLTAQAFADHATDLPIDYEHQTLGGAYSAPDGKAPAAGWIKGIFAEPGAGLFGQIEWTESAKQLLAGKAYRYLSPVAIIRKSDRKLVAIHSAALTNKPAIVGMQPIVNRILVFDGDEPHALTALRSSLGMPEQADIDEILIAAARALAEMRESARSRHVESRVREAMRAGKLVEAQRAWAEALVAKEEDLFDEWMRTAPVIVRCGALTAQAATDAPQRKHQALAHRARAEFRTQPLLSSLTTEDAFVADELRRAG